MFSVSSSILTFALLSSILQFVSAVGAGENGLSRIDLLERRIESLEQLTRTQSEAIEELLRRNLQRDGASSADDGCLPKRNSDNICVYDEDVEFLFHNASLVFNSSTVRFTGPILESNTTYCDGNVTTNVTVCEGNTTNLTTAYDFSSRVIFESTDVLVRNSNVSVTAQHNYTSFETNKTNITEHFGFFIFNNTNVALNSSRFMVISPDPRELNLSQYDDITYANLFSSVGFTFVNISIEDSNTTFTTNSSSSTDESSIVFNNTKMYYKYSDVSYTGSTTSVSESSVSYGKDTNVQWYGDSSSVYFTNGVEFNMDKSKVVLDDTSLELRGDEGRFVSRVDSQIRGPDGGDPIDFVVSRRVNVRFEQTRTMVVESDVDFLDDSKITVDEGAALVINGKLESNDESEFHGDIHMTEVKLFVERDLIIDGEDGDSRKADIEFRRGVDVRFFNDLQLDRNLNVAGHSSLETLEIAEETTMRGRLYCRRGATISGDTGSLTSITSMYSPELLKVEGSAYVRRDLKVEGSGSFKNINISEKAVASIIDTTNATVNNELRGRNAIITRQLTAQTIKAESDIVFENLDVSGTTTVRNLDVTGATKLYSLTVNGNANVGGTTTLGSLKGTSGSFTGRLTAGAIKSDSSLSSMNLAISEKTTTGSLSVTSNANIGGDLNVDGSVELDSTVFVDLTVLGTASVDTLSASSAVISGAATAQTLSLNGNAKIEGNLNVDGTTDLGSTSIDALTADSASISGAATVQTLTVNANAKVVGDLEIDGTIELDDTIFRNINVLGRATVGALSASSASITGNVDLQTLTVNANAKVGGNLDVDGSTELADTVCGDFSILGNMVAAGKGTVGSLNVTSDAYIGGDLNVGGKTKLENTVFVDLTVLGTAAVDSLSASSASISGSATIQRLNVDTNANIGGNLDVGGTTELAATVFRDISVLGTATVDTLSASSAAISGSATIETITVNADASVGGGLNVAGSMELDDTTFQNINVLGKATMDSLSTSSAEISGAASIETLTVNSYANVAGDFDVAGAMGLEATVFQNINVLGTATINSLSASMADISETLTITNDVNIGRDLSVDGSTELASTVFQDITVEGTATVDALSASTAIVSGALTVDADATVGGGLNVAGSIELDDTTFRNINVLGRAEVGSLLATSASISGATTVQTLSVDEDVEVRGDLNVEGAFAATKKEASFNNVAIAGNAVVGVISATNSTLRELTVSGNATVIGNLDVEGIFAPKNSRFTNIDVSGIATVGSLRATASATIEGQAKVKTLKVDDGADIGGDMNVGGSMGLASTVFQELSVVGTASIGALSADSARISGPATVQTLTVDADTAVGGSLSVDGSTSLENTVFRDITILGNADVDSLTASSASISSTATIGTLIVDNNAEIGDSLSVAGTFAPADSEFQDITVVGTASVGALVATTASVSDTATIQTLSVSADADVLGGLNVGGTFAPAESEFQDITVTGTATIGVLSASSANIDNTATIQTLSVSGSADVSTDLTIGGSFGSDTLECQDINVSGTASVAALLATTATVDDVASIETLSIGGNAIIAGNLTVSGTIGS